MSCLETSAGVVQRELSMVLFPRFLYFPLLFRFLNTPPFPITPMFSPAWLLIDNYCVSNWQVWIGKSQGLFSVGRTKEDRKRLCVLRGRRSGGLGGREGGGHTRESFSQKGKRRRVVKDGIEDKDSES